MKKVLIFASFIGSAILSQAQVSFGPKLGLGMSNQRIVAESGSNNLAAVDPKAVFSPVLGVAMNVKLNDYLAIQPGLQYAMMGSKSEFDYTINLFFFSTSISGSSKSTTHNIQLPILLKGQYPINDNVAVGLGVGPYVGLFLGGKAKNVLNGESSTVTIKPKGELSANEAGDDDNDVVIEEDTDTETTSYAQPIDFGIVIAPYVEFNNFQVALNYNVGLANQSSQYEGKSFGGYKTYNTWYGITAAYFFGGNK